MVPQDQPRFMTREQLREFLRERGYPIGFSTFVKLCSPSKGEGPPIAKMWGKRPLYTETGGLSWAQSRTRDPDEGVAA